MPVTQSAIRTNRQQEKRRIMNLPVKRAYKDAIRQFKNNPVEEGLSLVYKKVDKAVKRGVIKKGKAARVKSRLAHSISRVKKDDQTKNIATKPSKPNK